MSYLVDLSSHSSTGTSISQKDATSIRV
uniref:Uncharacterized protein n=1 Tax=Arundo donax TaxID=35708 RepID=A0A0A8Y472_ARUDO